MGLAAPTRLAGGRWIDPTGHFLTTAEVYDPKTGKFSPTGSMATERASHTATLLADGRVLITGGAASTASDAGTLSLASAELYDPEAGTFTATGSMADAVVAQTATLLPDGRVLIAGGHDRLTDVATAELYDPKAGAFSPTSPGD